MEYKPLSEREEEIAKAIAQAEYIVHKNLGPGLLEKIYEVCFCHELLKSGFHPQRQVNLPITYGGIIFTCWLTILFSDFLRVFVTLWLNNYPSLANSERSTER